MKQEDSEFISERLINNIRKYIELRMEYYRLDILEKMARATSFIISVLIVSLVLLFAFIFINIAIAFMLSDWLGSLRKGFGIFAVFYCVMAIFVVIFRKKLIQALIFNGAVENILYNSDSTDNPKKDA